VIAADLPGFGRSPAPPPGTPAGVESLTRLVSEFLDELGVERPHVAGNSLGGRVSLELAKLGRVRSATALSPAGFHNPLEAIYQQASLRMTIRSARAMAPHAEQLLRRPRIQTLAFAQMVARPRRIPTSDAVDSVRALADAPWFDETLKTVNREPFRGGEQIEVPVTIGWGDHDRLLLPRQARRTQTLIPHARVVTLPRCGHVPTYDDPDLVARVLLDGSGAG
jgi:pimeloyl-ACP methyl ester carboxylesterase